MGPRGVMVTTRRPSRMMWIRSAISKTCGIYAATRRAAHPEEAAEYVSLAVGAKGAGLSRA